MSHRALLSYGIIAGLAFCTQAIAAEGKYDMTSCFVGQAHVIQQGECIRAGSYDVVGMMPGQEGTPYRNLSGRCVGQFTIINGERSETGSCQYWDAAGDKIFGVYARKGDQATAEGTWHVVQGTGKFEGMTSEGKTIPIAKFPPVPNVASSCAHEWGTYSVK